MQQQRARVGARRPAAPAPRRRSTSRCAAMRVGVDAGLGDQERGACPARRLAHGRLAEERRVLDRLGELGAELAERRRTGPGRGSGRTWRRPRTRWCRRCRGSPRSRRAARRARRARARSRATWSFTVFCRCDVPRKVRGDRGQRLDRLGPDLARAGAEPAVDGLELVGDPDRRRPRSVLSSGAGSRSSDPGRRDRRQPLTAQLTRHGSSAPCGTVGPSPRRPGACAAPGPTYGPTGGPAGPVRFCSRMCALQPATRAQVNIEVNMCAGTSAKSSTTADQNSTLVASTRSGWRACSSASAAFSSASATSKRGRAQLLGGAAQHAGARVLGPVDPVAEAHQPLAAVEHALDVALRVAGCARPPSIMCSTRDGRAAVQRAGQRADARRRCRPRRRRRWRRRPGR